MRKRLTWLFAFVLALSLVACTGVMAGPSATVSTQATTAVQELIPMVADGDDRPIRVVDGDRLLGVVDRAAIMGALIEAR